MIHHLWYTDIEIAQVCNCKLDHESCYVYTANKQKEYKTDMIISDFGGECWRWVGRT